MKNQGAEKNYDDIIDYDWNRDSLPERMSPAQRAKIFLPFAALTGFDEALENKLRDEIEEVSREVLVKVWSD